MRKPGARRVKSLLARGNFFSLVFDAQKNRSMALLLPKLNSRVEQKRRQPDRKLYGLRSPSELAFGFLLFSCLSATTLPAIESLVVLQNGMTIGPGVRGSVSGVDQSAFGSNSVNGEIAAKPVLVLDDNLRLTFVRNALVQSVNDKVEQQKVITTGNADLRASGNHPRIAAVQTAIGVTPFDDFGRRIYSLITSDGPVEILQGITEISANHLRVEGLVGERSIIWDMRLSLNSIPAEKLRRILFNHVDLNRSQGWLDIVSLYWQAKRYREAREVLYDAIQKFPELEDLRPQLLQLDELNAELMFAEAEIRNRAGQSVLSQSLLEGFSRVGVSIETQVKIDRELSKRQADKTRIDEIKSQLSASLMKVNDPDLKANAEEAVDEIAASLKPSQIIRFADMAQLIDASAEKTLAVGISGWLMGSGSSISSLPLAASLLKARGLIFEYLNDADSARRAEIIEQLRKIEGGTTPYISQLAKLITPPQGFPNAERTPGRFDVEVPVAAIPGAPVYRYTIQLPPEYDANRKYPCVLTLHGEYSTAEDQIDWWSGPFNADWNSCLGEASRHGYIIVAPHWADEKKTYYDYTENEHAIVLSTLRDAMRRTSIDSDRIFLSGHHMGGDATWDIALAHPDLWAGMIAVGADCERYPIQYFDNAKYVPMYFVMGELDGAPSPLARNGKYLDRFLKSAQYDCLLVAYKGRGRDHFQEELPRIMQWMNQSGHKRQFERAEFRVTTQRPGDNFFWFLELRNISESVLVHPLQYTNRRAPEIEALLLRPNSNAVRVGGIPAEGFTLWLNQEQVSFDEKIIVYDRGRARQIEPQLDIAVILEDLRQRADRQHAFWLKADF